MQYELTYTTLDNSL